MLILMLIYVSELCPCAVIWFQMNFFGGLFGIFTQCMTLQVIYKLWIYLYRKVYFSIVYLHRDPISTKAFIQLISSLYEDIIRIKEKGKQRKEGHIMYSIFFYRRGIIYYII